MAVAEIIALLFFITILVYFVHLVSKFGFEGMVDRVIYVGLKIITWFLKLGMILIIVGFFAFLAILLWAILKTL